MHLMAVLFTAPPDRYSYGGASHRAGIDWRGPAAPGRRRLRPGLWRAAAQAGDPAGGAGPLALALLRGEFGEGDTVQVEARDGEIVFEKV